MLDAVMDGLGLETRDCIMTGDRLYTDIRMALDAGMPSAVVLTGEAKAQDLQDGPEDVPKYVLERKDHPIPTSLRAELGWKDD